MVEEAEEFAEQDKKVKGRVDARNQLETYCYNMKTTIEDKLGDKVEPSEKEKARALLGPRGRRVGLGSCGPRPAGTLCAAVAPLLGSSSGGYSEAAARARPRPALPARARASHTAVGRTPTLHLALARAPLSLTLSRRGAGQGGGRRGDRVAGREPGGRGGRVQGQAEGGGGRVQPHRQRRLRQVWRRARRRRRRGPGLPRRALSACARRPPPRLPGGAPGAARAAPRAAGAPLARCGQATAVQGGVAACASRPHASARDKGRCRVVRARTGARNGPRAWAGGLSNRPDSGDSVRATTSLEPGCWGGNRMGGLPLWWAWTGRRMGEVVTEAQVAGCCQPPLLADRLKAQELQCVRARLCLAGCNVAGGCRHSLVSCCAFSRHAPQHCMLRAEYASATGRMPGL